MRMWTSNSRLCLLPNLVLFALLRDLDFTISESMLALSLFSCRENLLEVTWPFSSKEGLEMGILKVLRPQATFLIDRSCDANCPSSQSLWLSILSGSNRIHHRWLDFRSYVLVLMRHSGGSVLNESCSVTNSSLAGFPPLNLFNIWHL